MRNETDAAALAITATQFIKLMRDAGVRRDRRLGTDEPSVDLVFQCALRWQRQRSRSSAKASARRGNRPVAKP